MYDIKRQPSHPGCILREEFLIPLGFSQTEFAGKIKTTFRTINEILNEKRSISPDMALRLARFLGTSEELWLNLQDKYDLYKAKERNKDILKEIRPMKAAVGM